MMTTTMECQNGGEDTTGWVDVSSRATQFGLSGRVLISNAAWLQAVYFVSDMADRNCPAKEGQRLGRLLVELVITLSGQRGRHSNAVGNFELFLPPAIDQRRGLTLPCAHLSVEVDQVADCPVIRMDVASGISISRQPGAQITELAA
ncbi:MAG: hypothetical protein ABI728_08055 [Betaproteobacteria bacterium]